MEHIEKDNELEIFRQQMQVLQEKLASQEIINEKLIIDSMKKKMSWIKKYIFFEFGLVPFIVIAWLGIKYMANLSWYNYAFLLIMCCFDVFYDYRINLHSMKDEDFQKCNMIETAKKLTTMKHHRAIQMMIQMPALIIWLIWAGFESVANLDLAVDDFRRGFVHGGLIGGTIGAIFGIYFAIKIYRKMQKTNDEVIKQINEYIPDGEN